jgi:hypothetical protein
VWGLALLVLIAAPSPAAWAADYEGEPPGQLRVIRIGDQTLLVDEVGNAILYQDPTPPEEVCAELEACWQVEVAPGASVQIAGGGVIRAPDQASGQIGEESAASP